MRKTSRSKNGSTKARPEKAGSRSAGTAKAEGLVQEAARGSKRNPQHRSTLRDQRDRTTGADQASRTDMHASAPDTLKESGTPAPRVRRKRQS